MPRYRTLAAFLLLLVAGCGRLWSQGLSGYTRHVWQASDGLPEQTVQAFAQTPDGYLWIGATRGLVRFLGAHFTVLQNTPACFEMILIAAAGARLFRQA